MIKSPLLPHQKTGLSFLWDQEVPNGQYYCNFWSTSPPGSTFNAIQIIKNQVISSFESLSANTPLCGILADDMRLGKTIQDIALIVTSKEQPATTPNAPHPPCLITNRKSEISKNSQAVVLQANIYHGPTCHLLPEANILKCDILITS
ncbi:hypothetical protein O181_033010 [Austropuccinia psidii MF-1]|uniref:SNF2 N-terminal domain-containing protein n=1 Tax=Austropuccinia psidii MF-1 TaxID=1389203 RepID=A0A9Q3D268_9BASI|nr:hypothetical protein [Austropuccinia psidii MF-1]